MLLKPIAEVPHEGRQPLSPVAGNTTSSASGLPKERNLKTRPGTGAVIECCLWMSNSIWPSSQHLLVLAHYPDGSVREITREGDLISNTVRRVSERGRGDRFCGAVKRRARALRGLLRDQVGHGHGRPDRLQVQEVAEHNYIDRSSMRS